ncbi:MAG TPA: RagB/SusD family nutrient uptake outer membrane protein, partial [Mucilaginibacter sp.]|nr:RagB/SusD family nutrient uptake outer membrane protein [Mucilaginibacter sp.]
LQFKDEVKNRDMRLQQTIRLGKYARSDGSLAPPDFNVTYSGYHILKYSLDDKYYDSRTENYNSIPIIRYAEVLLNYAEAKAELGTFTAADWSITVGALRTRAGITNVAMPVAIDKYMQTTFFPDVSSPALMEVRRERGIELAVEGFRYDDLKRWKAAKLLEKPYDGLYVPAKDQLIDLNEDGKPDVAFVDKIPATKVAGVVYFVLDNSSSKLSQGNKGNLIWLSNIPKMYPDKNYLYPIPANEIILNPNLKQNPGW